MMMATITTTNCVLYNLIKNVVFRGRCDVTLLQRHALVRLSQLLVAENFGYERHPVGLGHHLVPTQSVEEGVSLDLVHSARSQALLGIFCQQSLHEVSGFERRRRGKGRLAMQDTAEK